MASGWAFFPCLFLYAACLHAGLQYLPHGVKKLCCFPQFSHGFLYMIHLFFLYLISSPCPPPVATLAAFFMALFVCVIQVFSTVCTAVKRLTTTTRASPLNSFVWISENWRAAGHPRPVLPRQNPLQNFAPPAGDNGRHGGRLVALFFLRAFPQIVNG